jgi:hypothetical protein
MSEPEQTKPSCCDVRSLARLALVLSGLAALGAIALKALQQPALGFLRLEAALPDIGTTNARWIALILLVALVGTQVLVHKADRRNGKRASAASTGLGIIGRFEWRRTQGRNLLNQNASDTALKKQVAAAFHETDKSSVRAFMTKQSIFAALTLFLLKAVSSKLPAGFPGTGTEALYMASAAGFLATLLTVLVAIQIYSSYVRIAWDEEGGNELLKKGREMDEWSFYSLTLSILLALCAYQPWAALVAIPGFGILMHRYYFFA